MKKLILTITGMLVMTLTASSMTYEQAREKALFLTDKMAYELNLTNEQYEAAYEINLDYLMSITTQDDLYGVYWRQRNLDLEYILLDWQYRAYCAAAYFYRPLYWSAGYWRFGIYARYPYRDYFYFGRPTFYTVYRGGHSWRMNGGKSWYSTRPRTTRHSTEHFGMRDGFKRGDFGKGTRGLDRPNTRGTRPSDTRNDRNRNTYTRQTNGSNDRYNGQRGNSGYSTHRDGVQPESSTRTTVGGSTRGTSTSTERSNQRTFGGSRSNSSTSSNLTGTPNRTFSPSSSRSTGTSSVSRSTSPSTSRSSVGSSSRSFGGSNRSSGSSHSGSSRSGGGGHFGSRR